MDLTWMRRSSGPGVGVGRWVTWKAPAAFEGRIAARCWAEGEEDMVVSGKVACLLLVGLVDGFERMICREQDRMGTSAV